MPIERVKVEERIGNARIPLFLHGKSNHIFTVWRNIWYYW